MPKKPIYSANIKSWRVYERNKTACFTGHRKIPPEDLPMVKKKLKEILIESIGSGYRYFGAGGAMGFDTVAALTVLELKLVCPDIKLILVLPCKNQTRGWKETDIQKYEWIKPKADKVVYTSEHYYNGVCKCATAVAVCTRRSSPYSPRNKPDLSTKPGLFQCYPFPVGTDNIPMV